MRIARTCTAVALSVLAALSVGCTAAPHEIDNATLTAERCDVLYFCACGPECVCNTLSAKAGDCACGKPMQWGHVVKIEEDESVLCTCDEGCKCSINEKDPTQCECGQPLKRLSLKGSGLYFCNCGGTCRCNVISGSPGECTCGMQLTRVD